jgi:hypothetical protein
MTEAIYSPKIPVITYNDEGLGFFFFIHLCDFNEQVELKEVTQIKLYVIKFIVSVSW